jgi:hypothetical protein
VASARARRLPDRARRRLTAPLPPDGGSRLREVSDTSQRRLRDSWSGIPRVQAVSPGIEELLDCTRSCSSPEWWSAWHAHSRRLGTTWRPVRRDRGHRRRVPERELERRRRAARLGHARLDVTHPPTGLRIRLLESRPRAAARVRLDLEDVAAIDRELEPFRRSVHVPAALVAPGDRARMPRNRRTALRTALVVPRDRHPRIVPPGGGGRDPGGPRGYATVAERARQSAASIA